MDLEASMKSRRVVVVGAGVGGLVAALELATQGQEVLVVERADRPGGKLRQVEVAGQAMDAGPTVFTMRWVFDELFDRWGSSLAEQLSLTSARVLARHAWSADERLDLHADLQASADAIGVLAGPREARGFLAFAERARRIYQALEGPFIRDTRPTPWGLVARTARRNWRSLGDLAQISPFATLWHGLGAHFSDPRIRQLFGRYATYCGSSPFQAPATLMLVAHVEQDGVWLVQGGMVALAQALSHLAVQRGVVFRYGCRVQEILTDGQRASGVRLDDGEHVPAAAVVFNGDAAALAQGLLGRAVAQAVAAPAERSLSALTWNLLAHAEGFELARHTVFFSAAYDDEFRQLMHERHLPQRPTVYVCAQDRDDRGLRSTHQIAAPERLLCLVNAPATGDQHPFTSWEIHQCQRTMFETLARCGLRLTVLPQASLVTTPNDFARRYPGTQGALYGAASHGWLASFRRPQARCRIPGLYLAGGSTHPGPGVPMAALSGRLAADSCMHDLASTRPSAPVAMRGGTSTP